jgi:hypothetical protein
MSNQQPLPIDQESLNESDSEEVSKSPSEDDTGLWKVGDSYYSIEKMEDDFLRTAYFHALKKISEHAQKILRHQQSLQKFMEKADELESQAEARDFTEWIPVDAESAMREALSNNQQETVDA